MNLVKSQDKKLMHRNHLHPWTLTMKKKFKESIPFTTVTKRIKYLGINLPKQTKGLYTENCKTLMKEIKDDLNRWRHVPCFWVARVRHDLATQLLLLLLYTNNEKEEREIKKSIPFTIATKRIKYLAINLPKEAKNCTQKIIRH